MGLEVEAQFRREAARRHIVRSSEGGKEVIKRYLVGDIDGRELETPLVLVTAEKIVVAYRDVEQMASRDARRVVVVILGTRRGNGDSRRAVLRRGTRGQGRTQGGEHVPAE